MEDRAGKTRSERLRSPAYPHIGLAEAMETVAKLASAADASHGLNLTEAAGALGLKAESSWLNLRLAALKKFGLIEDLPAGESRERRIRLTHVALTLASLPRGEPLHKALRHGAALRPPIYQDLWEQFGPLLPTNAPMRAYLVQERQFNPQAVGALLENFRATIEYAGLVEQALSFQELAEAIEADHAKKSDGGERLSPAARARQHLREMTREAEAAAAAPLLGASLLDLSPAQLQALQKKTEAESTRRTASIPLDGNEDVILHFPREMTPQRWQTIIDTLALWKKQAESPGAESGNRKAETGDRREGAEVPRLETVKVDPR
jgi:hypothetical protein